jgi:hypothetical protein
VAGIELKTLVPQVSIALKSGPVNDGILRATDFVAS